MIDKPSARQQYRELSEAEQAAVDRIKQGGQNLLDVISSGVPTGHEKSNSLNRLEESIMWAVKGVTGK
jgi:hypothetical protein